MAFQMVEDYIRGAVPVAPPLDNFPFTLASGVAGTNGTAYYFHTDGTLKKCGAANIPQVICVGTAEAGGSMRGYWVTPGMVFKAPLVGNKSASLVPGIKAAKMTSTGDGIDATAYSGGKWSVIRIDETNGVIFVTPAESLFH